MVISWVRPLLAHFLFEVRLACPLILSNSSASVSQNGTAFQIYAIYKVWPFILKQGFLEPGLGQNSLCIWGWSWTPDALVSFSWALGFQGCIHQIVFPQLLSFCERDPNVLSKLVSALEWEHSSEPHNLTSPYLPSSAQWADSVVFIQLSRLLAFLLTEGLTVLVFTSLGLCECQFRV